MDTSTKKIFSWTYREPIAGYCRAIKKWPFIFVSGTTANDQEKIIGLNNPEVQMRFVMEKIQNTLKELWTSFDDIIKTTIYIKNQEDCEKIVRIHGEIFKNREPANTTIQANLIGDEYLVEVEAIAVCNK
jgi:enamine deaminase RidA (YjgF/YER057c/UK114 family)